MRAQTCSPYRYTGFKLLRGGGGDEIEMAVCDP